MDAPTRSVESNMMPELPGSQKHSLYEVCQQLDDGRAARGKPSERAGLLVLLVVAKLAGMNTLQGASDWIRDQQERLLTGLKLTWTRMSCRHTSHSALSRLDSQKANEWRAAWLIRVEAQSRCAEEPGRLAAQAEQRSVLLAIDGKGLKGTGQHPYGGEKPQKHGLHVDEVQTGIVLHHGPILDKQNEGSAFNPL